MKNQKSTTQIRHEEAHAKTMKLFVAYDKLRSRVKTLIVEMEEADKAWQLASDEERFAEVQAHQEEYPRLLEKIWMLHNGLLGIASERLTADQIALRDELTERYGDPTYDNSRIEWNPIKKTEEPVTAEKSAA